MKKITFNLPLSTPLNLGNLRLEQHAVPVELELAAGDHIFTSTPFEIGSYYHFKVFAQITIPYSYDSKLHYITICGPEDISDKQVVLHTCLDQHPNLINSHTLNSNGIASGINNMWMNFINNTPILKQFNQSIVQQIIDTLAKKLLQVGIHGVIQTGAAPFITPSNYQDYKAMFASRKTEVVQPSLEDLFEIQEIVNSSYYGTITWTENYSFANIIGSTHDPKPSPYDAWIRLWADKCNGGFNTDKCSSYQYSNGINNFNCNPSDFVGGHVIVGKVAASVATGGTAYIFPICKAHNGKDNIYMSSRYNPKGVVLHNYNQN
ncbi:hypothetical protein [Iodobacter fluviatilis]|uniref:Uncharacterized protein n=1 Tax=Iodobacter fluviatilis TaxID=537 RepID=A0A377Q5W8_9NEIS|nr:hypothetical protein [Iodobacter fluviatilis]TCU89296.1 hypothetical protein EV682_102208 [Iodobacter fluviatilis]STQ90666.1 Uncharacterised protein [Iodobacter fluviatilis]